MSRNKARTIPQWNKLPPEAKIAPDIPAFKMMLEKCKI